MRIVFFGTPEFAVASLDRLVMNGMNVVAAVTAPDKPSGRGLQMQSSAVKQYCIKNKIQVLEPNNLKDTTFLNELKGLNADLHIVVAFRMLPEQVWNMPTLGTYNLHASLLPKYRGAAPINWCLINGEKETGVTTFKLQHQIDTGNIPYFEKVKLTDDMNAGSLHNLLMRVGSELLFKTVKSIEQSVVNHQPLTFTQQNNDLASHAPKIFKEHCLIDWAKSTLSIYNLIRGLSPSPGATTFLYNDGEVKKSFKIFSSNYKIDKVIGTNGSLITDNKSFIKVVCTDGTLDLTEVQLEGKKRMLVPEFLRGYHLKENAFLKQS